MSVDAELEQRVVELEARVAELEDILDETKTANETDETDEPVADEIVETGTIDDPQPHPMDIIKEIPDACGDGVVVETVLRRLREEGFDDPEAEMDKLRRRGEIYSPSRDVVRVV